MILARCGRVQRSEFCFCHLKFCSFLEHRGVQSEKFFVPKRLRIERRKWNDSESKKAYFSFFFYSGVFSCCKRVNINLFVIKSREESLCLIFSLLSASVASLGGFVCSVASLGN